MKRRLQTPAATAQQPQRHAHVKGQTQDRELLLTQEAADFMRFTGPHAPKLFFKWANRWSVPRLHRGRTLLWERSVLIDFLNRKRWTRRHSESA